MSALFLKVVNMSITASWLILAAIVIRLLLKKAPKWISCLLWAIVSLRLIIPFSFESALSLIPSSEPIPSDLVQTSAPAINTGITIVDRQVNTVILDSFTPAVGDSINPLQILVPVLSILWVTGVVTMLLYALISFLRLKKIVSSSVELRKGVKVCDKIESPFIFGVIGPVIYVPSALTEKALENVLAHENAHLSRKDHWWKPFGFFLLAIYWFNPLCWIAYVLLCRDIEAACDEKVIRDMNKEDRAEYSQTLLDLSFSRKNIAACPLAFGEVGVKERVKGVLNYRKPAFWIIVTAIIVCIVLAVCFLTNPKDRKTGKSFTAVITSVNESTLLVKPENGSDELKSADTFSIPVSKLEEGYIPQVGDALEIFYDGYIYAIYPADLGTIERITYLKSTSDTSSETRKDEIPETSKNSSKENSESVSTDDMADKTNSVGYELAPYEQEIEINTCYYDITHDGIPDAIQVTYIVTDDFDGVINDAMFHNGALGFIKLFEGKETDGSKNKLLWYRDYGSAHTGNVQVFVTTVDGKDYLVETSLYAGQGTAYYSYSVFSFENDEKQVVDSDKLTFETDTKTDTTAFFDGIYSWINSSSILLMATDIDLDPDIYYSHGQDIVRPEVYYSQKKGFDYMANSEG